MAIEHKLLKMLEAEFDEVEVAVVVSCRVDGELTHRTTRVLETDFDPDDEADSLAATATAEMIAFMRGNGATYDDVLDEVKAGDE